MASRNRIIPPGGRKQSVKIPRLPGPHQFQGGRLAYHRIYDEAFVVPKARKMALLGATVEKMAEFFGTTARHFHVWMNRYPALKEAVHEGRLGADIDVANAMYKRAKGWKHSAQKIMQYNGEPVIVDYIERFPPDTAAGKFWLTNRHPELWQDRVNSELSGPNRGKIEIKIVNPDDAQL